MMKEGVSISNSTAGSWCFHCCSTISSDQPNQWLV